MEKLVEELIELSKKVDDFSINSIADIKAPIELSSEVEIPFVFTCEALHPGTYKGYSITEDEIIQGQNTIFYSSDNHNNYDVNKDHKSSRKPDSSVDDIVGKVIEANYDNKLKAYIISSEIYDKAIALKIANGLIKFVSLRIKPTRIVENYGQRFAQGLIFEELSLVRSPGDPNARITSINKR